DEFGCRVLVAPQADRMQRRMADVGIAVLQSLPDRGASALMLDARGRPHALAPGSCRGARRDGVSEGRDGGCTLAAKGVSSAAADEGTAVVEQRDQALDIELAPRDGQAARVLDAWRAGAADAVDGTADVWLDELRAGAAQFVPAAGVDHEQAA